MQHCSNGQQASLPTRRSCVPSGGSEQQQKIKKIELLFQADAVYAGNRHGKAKAGIILTTSSGEYRLVCENMYSLYAHVLCLHDHLTRLTADNLSMSGAYLIIRQVFPPIISNSLDYRLIMQRQRTNARTLETNICGGSRMSK